MTGGDEDGLQWINWNQLEKCMDHCKAKIMLYATAMSFWGKYHRWAGDGLRRCEEEERVGQRVKLLSVLGKVALAVWYRREDDYMLVWGLSLEHLL